jgi:hypothetical protein
VRRLHRNEHDLGELDDVFQVRAELDAGAGTLQEVVDGLAAGAELDRPMIVGEDVCRRFVLVEYGRAVYLPEVLVDGAPVQLAEYAPSLRVFTARVRIYIF